MTKFQLAEGERELVTELVTGVRGGKRVPHARLVLTEQRLGLSIPKQGGVSKVVGALFGKQAARLAGKLDVAYQIRRSEFERVEQPARDMIVFHNSGAGYAHVSFEVYGASELAVWEQRMRAWVAGDLAPVVAPS